MKYLSAIIFLVSVSAAAKETKYGADLFSLKNPNEKMFTLEVVRTLGADGVTKTLGVFKDLKGAVAVREDGELKGSDLIFVKTKQFQLKEEGEIRLEGDRVFFKFQKDGDKKKEYDEPVTEKVIVPANLEPYILENWDSLLKKKTLNFRFALWDRMETVRFSLLFHEEKIVGGETLIKFKLKPRNFIISSLIDPIFFEWNKTTKVLLAAESRVAPYRPGQNGFKPLDALVKYVYN